MLGDLAVQPDVDVRFLGVVMNFNDVYVPKKRRRERPGEKDRKTPVVGQGEGERTDSAAGSAGGAVEERKVEEKKGAGGVIGTAANAAEKGRGGVR